VSECEREREQQHALEHIHYVVIRNLENVSIKKYTELFHKGK